MKKTLISSLVVAGLFSSSVGARDAAERQGTPPESPDLPNFTRAFADTPRAISSVGSIGKASSDGSGVSSAVSATDVAIAMGIPAGQIISASIGTSDPEGVGISDTALGHFFPTQGSTFAILSTGKAATAATANSSGSTSSTLTGLNNSQGRDMVQLTLELDPPTGATCMSFDIAFYSEEYPEFVNTSFNDVFTAEYLLPGTQSSDLTIVNNAVVAPHNFAFDGFGKLMSVNTTLGAFLGQTGTTYDGSTPRIQVISPIDNDTSAGLVLTIQDLGDSIYDSSIFIDKFLWGSGNQCNTGAFVDTDNDGLLDDWETNGIDIDDGTGNTIHLDLPAMGADPMRKDVFVEIDYMEKILADGSIGISHKPIQSALDKIVQSFADAPVSNPDDSTGITLHIDAGPASVMIPATPDHDLPVLWGARSRANRLPYSNTLGTCPSPSQTYKWDDFEAVKQANFPVERRDVFHYNAWIHHLCPEYGTVSGISRGIPASDFIVSLGGWTNDVGSESEQAGTFMHELGHNFGFKHGGVDHFNYKPNFVSIMNYFFQTRGLRFAGQDGLFDYSRVRLNDLDENALNETSGVEPFTGGLPGTYGTKYWCKPAGASIEQLVNDATAPIDWNCDGSHDASVASDINRFNGSAPALSILKGGNHEWDEIKLSGGAIGALGLDVVLEAETEVNEAHEEDDAALKTDIGVSLSSSAGYGALKGSTVQLEFALTNTGTKAANVRGAGSSSQGWANLSSLNATSISLAVGQTKTFTVPVDVPAGASLGDTEVVTFSVKENSNLKISDIASTTVVVANEVLELGDANGDGTINALDIISLINHILESQSSFGKIDCNADGNVNSLDLICEINKILTP